MSGLAATARRGARPAAVRALLALLLAIGALAPSALAPPRALAAETGTLTVGREDRLRRLPHELVRRRRADGVVRQPVHGHALLGILLQAAPLCGKREDGGARGGHLVLLRVPRFDASIWPDRWYDGGEMTPARYTALAHILMADTYSSNGNYAMFGCSAEFREWIGWNVLGFDSPGNVINEGATGRIIAARTGEVPSSFEPFMLYTGASTQVILSFTYSTTVKVSKVRVRGLGAGRPRLLARRRRLRDLPQRRRRGGGREPRRRDRDRGGRLRGVGEPGGVAGDVLRQGGLPVAGLRARPGGARGLPRKRLRVRLRGAARHRAHRAQEGRRRNRRGDRAGRRDARRGRLPGELRARRRDGDGRGNDRRRDDRVRGHPPRRGRDQGGVAFRRLPARPGGPPHRGDGGDGAVGRRGRRGVAGRRDRRARAARRPSSSARATRSATTTRTARSGTTPRATPRSRAPSSPSTTARRPPCGTTRTATARSRTRRWSPPDGVVAGPLHRVQRIAGRVDGVDAPCAPCRTGPTRSSRRRPPRATPARAS